MPPDARCSSVMNLSGIAASSSSSIAWTSSPSWGRLGASPGLPNNYGDLLRDLVRVKDAGVSIIDADKLISEMGAEVYSMCDEDYSTALPPGVLETACVQ